MREISPAEDATVEEYLNECVPAETRMLVSKIREQKQAGTRSKPSEKLIDKSKVLDSSFRKELLDKVAQLVDENCTGRSDMCRQFASLMHKALTHLGLSPRVVIGTAVYYDPQGRTLYRWPDDGHDWIAVNDEIIDGNVDSIFENPRVPPQVNLHCYWGPRSECPRDRKFNENRGARTRPLDNDVEKIWWPDLKEWLEQKGFK